MLLSALVIVLAIVALRRFGHGRWLVWWFAGVIMGLVILSGIHFGLKQITGEGVNVAVFYHMRTGVEGGDVSQYFWVVGVFLLVLFGISAALWRWRRLLQPRGLPRKKGIDTLIAAFAFSALLVHPVIVATASYALRFTIVAQQKDGYFALDAAVPGPEKPRNLVVIYLESLERTYMDAGRFPGLTPQLSELEQRAITFTDMGQTAGADFTVGGMVATQCGVPLILSGGGNSMQVNQFLSGATCLGDILEGAGYKASYLGGASTEFAGKGAFYKSHGYSEVSGLEELLPLTTDQNYRAQWGLQDDTLFDLARDRFDGLASQDTPFVLTMLTLDTHHPNGHAETNRVCATMRYGAGDNPMLNSVLCADHLVGQFINDILAGPHGKDTVVAVMSDHLGMVNAATDLLEAGPRRNMLMILDGANPDLGSAVKRPATTLDTGPTLLSYLGFDVPRLGLGVDLLRATPATAPETLGIPADDRAGLDAYIMGFEAVYTGLWMLPDISNGVYVNKDSGEVQFGNNTFRAPALFTFSQAGEITLANLGDPLAEETLSKAALKLPDATRYIWFDECRLLGHLETDGAAAETDDLCYVHGQRGFAAHLGVVGNQKYLSADDLAKLIEGDGDPDPAGEDTAALERIGRARGDFPVSVALPKLANGGRGVLVRSSAFEMGASFVRRQTVETIDSGEDWALERGITLIGIGPDGRAETLDVLDQCNPDFDPASHPMWKERIQKSGEEKFLAHLVVVHDSAHCGAAFETWSAPLTGLELGALRNLQPRQAYAAMIDASGAIQEFSDTGFGRVALFLAPDRAIDAPQTVLSLLPAATAPTNVVAQKPLSPVAEAASTTTAAAKEADKTTDAAANLMPVNSACIAPPTGGTASPSSPLVAGIGLSGSNFADQVGFGSGWWDQEADGRWAGAQRSQLSVILPESGEDLQLALQLVSLAESARTVRIEHQGRLLASATISTSTALSVKMGGLPQGVPIKLDLVLEGDPLDCPVARGEGSDVRSLGVMLQSVVLEISDPAAAALDLANADNSSIDLATPAPGCIQPAPRSAMGKVATEIAKSRFVPVPEALSNDMLVLGAGWWEPEDFGVWLGAGKASFNVTLPKDPADFSLFLWVTPFGQDDITMSVSYSGREIATGIAGAERPLAANVSALPRGIPITLSLSLPKIDVLGCPASQKIGSDTRALGLMLQALELR